jgi:hypothetical protein
MRCTTCTTVTCYVGFWGLGLGGADRSIRAAGMLPAADTRCKYARVAPGLQYSLCDAGSAGVRPQLEESTVTPWVKRIAVAGLRCRRSQIASHFPAFAKLSFANSVVGLRRPSGAGRRTAVAMLAWRRADFVERRARPLLSVQFVKLL